MSNLIAKRRVDYVIVGQGLAGSCLAIQLCTRNKSVMVFDQPHLNHSTAVAAGLFNPITGKMLAKTWQADVLFPYFYSFYRHAESLLNKKFFFPIPIYRPFSSVEEQNEWMGRSTPSAAVGMSRLVTASTQNAPTESCVRTSIATSGLC